MRKIVVASQKGGSGKSTICAHLSVMAGKKAQTVVADLDAPQGSLSQWWNVREATTPVFVQDYTRASEAEYLFVDTPPRLDKVVQDCIRAAHLVIIPVRPSPHDLRAVGIILEAVEKANTPFIFVINGATSRSKIASDIVRSLAQHGKVAPVTLHNRIDYVNSMIDGRTAMELNAKSKASEEITELWKYVYAQLRK